MFLIALTTNQTIIITINTRFFEKNSHVSFFFTWLTALFTLNFSS